MRLAGVGYHLDRLRNELGRKLVLAGRGYRVRGFIPNRQTTDFRHETYLLSPLRRALAHRPGTFVDVGVNTGQTLLKLLEIAPDRPYLGFEPQVGCCFFIDQFLRDNHVTNAQVICLALSDEDGMLPIFSQGQFDEMASLVQDSTTRIDRPVEARFIPVRIGDDVLENIGVRQIGVLKVDVEGAELKVFRGLTRALRHSRPVCFFEVLPNFVGEDRRPIAAASATRNRDAAAELMQFFMEVGYEIRQIDPNGGETPITIFDLDTPSAFVSSDYVAYARS
jgi:FkbM family methyltransferase